MGDENPTIASDAATMSCLIMECPTLTFKAAILRRYLTWVISRPLQLRDDALEIICAHLVVLL
jgi:hypothetical protein